MKSLIFLLLFIGSITNVVAQNSVSRNFSPPIMGWSSWNTYRVNINAELIKKQADALISQGLKEVGYNYINIDDGFFGGRDESGNLIYNKERFSEGVKPVCDYIHSLGLKAGIYSEAGSNTCGSVWDNDANGIGSGLYGHEQQDLDLFFKEWNFDFIKIDYCGALDLGLNEEERYRKIKDAINATGRKNISMNICRWAFPGTWAKDIATSWRISGDISPNWESIKQIINKNLYLSAFAVDGHYNDMDMLEIGRGLSQSEEEVHFGIWCIMSSPLLIGCDMTTIPAASLQLLKNKELISLNQDPLGLQAYVVQNENNTYVLVKDIETKRGKTRAAALYNPTDSTVTISVPTVAFELGGKVKMRDLIAQKNIGDVKDSITMTLVPHSVKMLRLEGEKRLDPTLYEAEWGYMPMYDDLERKNKQITFQSDKVASGGVKVINIGGKAQNSIEWKDVYSSTGGNYKMTIYYSCKDSRNLEVSVNGKKQVVKNLVSGDKDAIATRTIEVNLKKGNNEIKMCTPYGWSPDIDKFTLVK